MSKILPRTAFRRVLEDSGCSTKARLHALSQIRPSLQLMAKLLARKNVIGRLREKLTEAYEAELLRREIFGRKNGRPRLSEEVKNGSL